MGSPHSLYLATTHSGRKYVMGFRRMGMQGAQPIFRINERLVPASDLVEFQVGDGTARGFKNGYADNTVYRYDVSGIDAADARLIAAAPELLDSLDPDTLEVVAKICDTAGFAAAATALRMMAKTQAAAITKATQGPEA